MEADDVLAANRAFYAAFEARDLERMSDVWEHSDSVVCTHPGWATLRGWGAISGSFVALFTGSQHLQFILTREQAEVVGVREEGHERGGDGAPAPQGGPARVGADGAVRVLPDVGHAVEVARLEGGVERPVGGEDVVGVHRPTVGQAGLKSTIQPTEEHHVFRTTGGMAAALDAVLADLPPGFQAVGVGGSHLVVGPTGAFLLTAADQDPATAGARLGRLAQRLRVLLAAYVGSTPYVDALVVAEPSPQLSSPAPVVSPRRVRDTLLSGPELLTAGAVERLLTGAEAAARDLLDPPD